MFILSRNRSILISRLGHFIRCEHTSSRTEFHQSKMVLEKCGFSTKQTELLLTNLEPYLQKDSPEIIRSSFECWRKNLRSKSNDIIKNDQSFIDVFLTKEPRLLLLKNDHILQRIQSLKSLDLVRGSNDLWALFLKAPSGCYLQDWREFLKKYYYVTYKILPWIEPQIENNAINPLVKCPAVVELTFNIIKTRYLFAKRAGYKEVNTKHSQFNLYTLLLLPLNDFIQLYGPYCSLEEFLALEKLNSHATGEEDDKLFEDLVDLAPKGESKSFIDNNLKESYLLSSVNRL